MNDEHREPTPRRKLIGLPSMILLGALGGVLAVGGVLYMRAASSTNQVALASQPKPVTAVLGASRPFQPTRRYVGTIEPWLSASVGPQMISAYVDTVLVRPGDVVKRGAVLATLDCRNASAMSKVVAAQARAIDAMHTASANEASRVSSLLAGKYVSQNEVDQKSAEAASKEAQLAALQAQAVGTSLQVDDCVLRSAFDGEISDRRADPGSFVRPGSSIATIIDRHMIRISAEVPEDDFDSVAPGTPVRLHLLADGKDLTSRIARRSPGADPATRTTHIEIDIDNADKAIPVWTTAELSLDVGAPIAATAVPLASATVHAGKAKVFVVDNGIAHLRRALVIGEREGTLFLDPKGLPAGTPVVTEGRNLLDDGEPVAAKVEK
jgi:membrane fusion protein (multidrug efflux system)